MYILVKVDINVLLILIDISLCMYSVLPVVFWLSSGSLKAIKYNQCSRIGADNHI